MPLAAESREDLETEPYLSKYSAQALLQEVRQQLSAAVRQTVLEYKLDVNHSDTEEMPAGEEPLQRYMQLREPTASLTVSLYIQAQQVLALESKKELSPEPNEP